MKLLVAVIHPVSVFLPFEVYAKANGDKVLVDPGAGNPSITLLGTTSSTTFEPVFTAKYTIDTEGIIDIGEIRFDVITFNGFNTGLNAESIYQISGDGGQTFTDVTTAINSTQGIETIGQGKWIDNVEIGLDKLQIRVLGRSTDGNPASMAEGNAFSLFLAITIITFVKRLPRPF